MNFIMLGSVFMYSKLYQCTAVDTKKTKNNIIKARLSNIKLNFMIKVEALIQVKVVKINTEEVDKCNIIKMNKNVPANVL